MKTIYKTFENIIVEIENRTFNVVCKKFNSDKIYSLYENEKLISTHITYWGAIAEIQKLTY